MFFKKKLIRWLKGELKKADQKMDVRRFVLEQSDSPQPGLSDYDDFKRAKGYRDGLENTLWFLEHS
jgi:hypothetical protein